MSVWWYALKRGIYDRLRLEIWRAMGFEPIVDSSGRLVKMIVRAWADDSCCLLNTHLDQGHEAVTCTASRARRMGGMSGG